MQKARYAVDDRNRLVVRRGKTRLVPAGNFSVRDNVLFYLLNEPQAWLRQNSLPKKIRFSGTWKLDQNKDLVLHVSQGKNARSADTLTLHGCLLPPAGDSLAFELVSEQPGRRKEYRILQLAGSWKAAGDNGLFFEARKRASADVLSLGTGWKLGTRQQIVYAYEKTDLLTKTKSEQSVEFQGSWQVLRKNYLTYILSRGTASRFDFRVQAESGNLYPQKGVLKFRLGAGARQKTKGGHTVITLYGTWKVSTPLSLSFEMDRGDGRVKSLAFGADIDLSRKDKIVFSLVDRERRPLGMQVIFSHRFLKKLDAEAFMRLKKLREESAIELGVWLPF